jgi:hypothetical protein
VVIAIMHLKPAAVQPPHFGLSASVVRIVPYLTHARKHMGAVLLTVILLRTLMLTLKEPLWTKPKGWV